MDSDRRQQTAWHEAGHAVAYVLLGRRFRYVTINPRTPGLSGAVQVRPVWIPANLKALICAAGPVAEARYLTDQGLDEDEVTAAIIFGGCGEDFNALRQLYPVSVEAQADAERGAESLLGTAWPAVEGVAGRLLASRRTLHGAEVSALVGASMKAAA